jgi:hypothetical protein
MTHDHSGHAFGWAWEYYRTGRTPDDLDQNGARFQLD